MCIVTSLGYRAARDLLKRDLAGQERMIGVFLSSLALADVRRSSSCLRAH